VGRATLSSTWVPVKGAGDRGRAGVRRARLWSTSTGLARTHAQAEEAGFGAGQVYRADLFKTDVTGASVVTIYLLRDHGRVAAKLAAELQRHRVVTHDTSSGMARRSRARVQAREKDESSARAGSIYSSRCRRARAIVSPPWTSRSSSIRCRRSGLQDRACDERAAGQARHRSSRSAGRHRLGRGTVRARARPLKSATTITTGTARASRLGRLADSRRDDAQDPPFDMEYCTRPTCSSRRTRGALVSTGARRSATTTRSSRSQVRSSSRQLVTREPPSAAFVDARATSREAVDGMGARRSPVRRDDPNRNAISRRRTAGGAARDGPALPAESPRATSACC